MIREGKSQLRHQFPVPGRHLYPWLLYHHGKRPQDLTLCTISSSGPIRSEPKRIPELRNKEVVYCSPDGRWLLLRYPLGPTEYYYSVWNPTTSESIGLPCVRTDLVGHVTHGLLSTLSPTDPDCLILLFLKTALILYCRPGDDEWIRFDYTRSIEFQTGVKLSHRYYLSHPVRFDGKIYATASCFPDLVHIDIDYELKDCTTSLIHRTDLKRFAQPFHIRSFSLVACGDLDLCLITICYNLVFNSSFQLRARQPEEIGIFKFNFSTNSWEDMTSLNCRAIFLGQCYSFSCPVVDDHSGKGWSYIHFNSVVDLTLYSYRVEDERITSHLPCIDTPTPRLAPVRSCWIMPAAKDIDHDQPAINHEMDQQSKQNLQWLKKKRRGGMGESWKSKRIKRALALEDGSEQMAKNGESMLCDLPQEVLGLISGNLSFVDYMNFRCANRVCASGTIGTRTKPFPPSLVYHDRVNGVYYIIDSNLNQKISVKIPEVLKDYRIRCSNGGWLLMEYLGDIALFNPFTMEVVPVASRPRDIYSYIDFAILSRPSCSDCSVLAFARFEPRESKLVGIYACKPREGKWTKLIIDLTYIQCSNSPTLLKGCCYYFGYDGSLGRFQYKNARFAWYAVMLHTAPCDNFQHNFLTECGGDLISIFIGRRGKRSWIRLFKRNPEDDEYWEEIKTLGSYSLYLSRSSSMARIAESPDMANRIYFPRFYNNGLVYYSLNTKKYHSTGMGMRSRDVVPQDFYGTSMYWNCAWIEPSWCWS